MRDDFSNQSLFLDAAQDVVGVEGIDSLRRDFGGQCLYVPCARLRQASPLARALGMQAASAIVGKLRVLGPDDRPIGGFSIYVPAGRHSARETTRSEAVEAVRGGMTRRTAARLAGLAERTVQRAAQAAGIAGQAQRLDALDAALVAAHAEDPSGPAMAARLGVGLNCLHGRLASTRRRTGLALTLVRPTRPTPPRGPSREEQAAARDAAVIAAHAVDPTMAGMAAQLGISRDLLDNWLRRARARSGLALAVAGRPNATAALDAAVVAAHAAEATVVAMAARLGMRPDCLRARLARTRRRTGLALPLAGRPPRPDTPPPVRPDTAAARDAEVVAAHAAEATIAAMAARLGVGVECMRGRLTRARERTGLALALAGRPARPSAPCRSRRSGAEVDAELLAAHAAGLAPPEIAARMGVRLDYVYHRFWQLRRRTGLALTFDRRPYHEELWGEHVRSRQAQVEACLREGLSRPEIAARLGVSLSTVGNFRRKVREATGDGFVPPPRKHPHDLAGRDHRHRIAAAFAPGVTLDDLTARTGLGEVVIAFHLTRLRRETGQAFTLSRRCLAGRASP